MTDLHAVEFYWRQGCGFCSSLERGLTRAGIPLDKHNIWENPDDAAYVRSVARGNETVPTVRVGSTTMVNPRLAEVIEALQREAPHLVPDDLSPQESLIDRLLGR